MWRLARIDEVKAEVKAELNSIAKEKGDEARLEECLKRIEALSDSSDGDDRLRCIVYGVSALYHHRRFGGLTNARVAAIAELVHAILQVENVKSGRSKFSFFYGELQLILSQIDFQNGDMWRSAWNQELASYLSKPVEIMPAPNVALAKANRLGRLGLLTDERAQLKSAIGAGISRRMEEGARLKLLRSLRLSGRFEEFEKELNDLETLADLSEEGKLDLEWERGCYDLMAKGSDGAILRMVRFGSTHFTAQYFVEGYLWLYCVQGAPHDQLPKYDSARRRYGSELRQLGVLTQIYRILDESQDGKIPLANRIVKIGSVVEMCNRVATIEIEMLVLVAVTKWLLNRKATEFARLTYGEYQKLSLLATDGASDDALCFCKNVQFQKMGKDVKKAS